MVLEGVVVEKAMVVVLWFQGTRLPSRAARVALISRG